MDNNKLCYGGKVDLFADAHKYNAHVPPNPSWRVLLVLLIIKNNKEIKKISKKILRS